MPPAALPHACCKSHLSHSAWPSVGEPSMPSVEQLQQPSGKMVRHCGMRAAVEDAAGPSAVSTPPWPHANLQSPASPGAVLQHLAAGGALAALLVVPKARVAPIALVSIGLAAVCCRGVSGSSMHAERRWQRLARVLRRQASKRRQHSRHARCPLHLCRPSDHITSQHVTQETQEENNPHAS